MCVLYDLQWNWLFPLPLARIEPSSSGPQFSHSTEWKLWCAVLGLLWTGPSDFHKMCALQYTTLPYTTSKLHLHHSFTKQPWTNGYLPRDIRARKRRPGTVRPSSNSDRRKTFEVNKAVWGPGFRYNCQCTITVTPQQTAYRSAQTLRVFCDIKRRRFTRASRCFDRNNVFILERQRNQEDRSIRTAVGTSPSWTAVGTSPSWTLRLSLRRTSAVQSLYVFLIA
jgi:hypothetical protein